MVFCINLHDPYELMVGIPAIKMLPSAFTLSGSRWKWDDSRNIWIGTDSIPSDLTVCYGIDGPFIDILYLSKMVMFHSFVELPKRKFKERRIKILKKLLLDLKFCHILKSSTCFKVSSSLYLVIEVVTVLSLQKRHLLNHYHHSGNK